MTEETAGTPKGLAAWDDDTALMGPKAPKWNGQIEHLIRYLLTVHKRFGNTAVTADLKWGASALWKRDEQKERIELLEREVAALTTQRDELWRQNHELRTVSAEEGQRLVWAEQRAETAEAQRDELQKRIDTAVPLVAGGANTNQWIPVTQRFPPACHFLLVYAYRDGDPSHERCRVVREYYVSTHPAECVADDGITHWMPLPPAPDTGTAQATECETNGTEGLRAELDAAKRTLQLAHEHMQLYLVHYIPSHNVYEAMIKEIK